MSRDYQRQLAMLDTPAGDLGAFKKEGGKIKLYDMGGGGGGGGGQPANTTQTQTAELPEWARGYAKDVLAKGQALTDTSQNPYQAYTGQRQADFSGLQKTAMQSVASPEAWGKNVQGYMSPYMDNVVKRQQQNAVEQAGIQSGALNAKAAQMGAFGGSGVALQRAQQGRDLQRQLGDIQATGLQTAFQQGTQQANQALGQQMQLGALQQAQEQKGYDTAYQDFLAQKNYPYQQLSYMSNLVRGTPMGMNTTSQVYQAPPNTLGQVAGLGAMAYGMSKMAGGGEVKGYAGDEGSLTIMDKFNNPNEMLVEMDKLTDAQLQAIIQAPATRAEGEAAKQELAMRASESHGLSNAWEQVPYSNRQNIVRAAGGGVLAFSGDDDSLVRQQDLSDRAALLDTLDRVGAAGKDLLTLPGRGLMGAFETGVTRPLRAVGVPIPYLPKEAYGGDSSSITPYYDKIRARDTERENAKTWSDFDKATDAYMAERPETPEVKTKGAGDKKSGPRAPGITAAPSGVSTTPAAGGGTNTFEENFKTAKRLMADPEAAADRKALNELIAQQGNRAADLKKQAASDFWMQYGAAMAQNASQPGQSRSPGLGGLLQVASAAAPAGISSIMENRRAVAAAQDANLKMQIEQRKYNIAESKNDRTAMLGAAHNMQMLSQQQAQLGEMIRHNKASEGLMSQRIAAGNTGLESAMLRSKAAIAQSSMKQAAKDWNDPLNGPKLRKDYPTLKAYQQELFNQQWSQTMPQLSYLGTLGGDDTGG